MQCRRDGMSVYKRQICFSRFCFIFYFFPSSQVKAGTGGEQTIHSSPVQRCGRQGNVSPLISCSNLSRLERAVLLFGRRARLPDARGITVMYMNDMLAKTSLSSLSCNAKRDKSSLISSPPKWSSRVPYVHLCICLSRKDAVTDKRERFPEDIRSHASDVHSQRWTDRFRKLYNIVTSYARMLWVQRKGIVCMLMRSCRRMTKQWGIRTSVQTMRADALVFKLQSPAALDNNSWKSFRFSSPHDIHNEDAERYPSLHLLYLYHLPFFFFFLFLWSKRECLCLPYPVIFFFSLMTVTSLSLPVPFAHSIFLEHLASFCYVTLRCDARIVLPLALPSPCHPLNSSFSHPIVAFYTHA